MVWTFSAENVAGGRTSFDFVDINNSQIFVVLIPNRPWNASKTPEKGVLLGETPKIPELWLTADPVVVS